MVDQSAHSARDEPLSPSLSNSVQAVRTRQPIPRSPPTWVLTTPSTLTSIRSRRSCRHLGPSELRSRTELLGEACAPRGDRPILTLVAAGRGGLPQDPEATLPALYIAGRDGQPQGGAGHRGYRGGCR